MGYKAEKDRIEGQLKILKRIMLGVATGALVGLCVFSAFVPANTWKYRVGKPKIASRVEKELRIHFIDVGQGDATIVELPDGRVLLIDGGDGSADANKALLRYMYALKLKTVDYLVVTHADSDHCGGLDEVMKNFDVKRAYIPATETTVNIEYAEFYSALMKEDCDWTYVSRKIDLSSKNDAAPYVLTALYPYSDEEITEEESNDASAVLWLDYCGVSALFMGDAPTAVEETLLREDKVEAFADRSVHLKETEILKVAHHGSADSTSKEFLDYLNIETAVISCGENNVYGHPTQTVCKNLQDAEVETYRTDLDGSVMITVTEDGKYTIENMGK
jgi:beta-lactamase superfamily II metal-dependent hydrolase